MNPIPASRLLHYARASLRTPNLDLTDTDVAQYDLPNLPHLHHLATLERLDLLSSQVHAMVAQALVAAGKSETTEVAA